MITLEQIQEYLTALSLYEETKSKLKASPVYQELDKEKKCSEKIKKSVADQLIAHKDTISPAVQKFFNIQFEQQKVEAYDYYKIHITPKAEELDAANGSNDTVKAIREILTKVKV